MSKREVLRLSRALKTFTYDPSRTFRGWLRSVTQHALSDFAAERRRRPVAIGGDSVRDVLATVKAREELLSRLEEEFDREVLAQACEVVRARVEPQTWEAFRLITSEGRSGEEVATQLGLNVMAVFKAKSRVLGFLREEVKRLNGDP
ncbi:MAG: RNA polymerase sigma factor [Isosphaeraceae bacterium]